MIRRVCCLLLPLAAACGFFACGSDSSSNAPAKAAADAGRAADSSAGDTDSSTTLDTDAGNAGNCRSLVVANAGTPTACSDADGGIIEAGLVVKNGCDEPVELVWVDFDCKETSYQTIPANSEAAQGSFVGHPWRLRIPGGGGGLIKEIPRLTSGTTTITVP